MKSGQISTEFMFSLGMMFIALIIILAINFEKGKQLNDLKNFVDGRKECLEVANTINSLFINGPSTQAKVNVYNLVTIYNNSRIEVYTNSTGELIAQCFYTAKVALQLTNFTGSISLMVDDSGQVLPG